MTTPGAADHGLPGPDPGLGRLTRIARDVADAYRVRNHAHGRPPWTVDNYMSGFVGDVGDLSKLIMARSGYRDADDLQERLEHELADCLWSILVIADEVGVDIEAVYRRSMDALLRQISGE